MVVSIAVECADELLDGPQDVVAGDRLTTEIAAGDVVSS